MSTTLEAPPILLDEIEKFRAAEFEKMGFSEAASADLASLRSKKHGGYEYDVHKTRDRLKSLMDRGCSPELAARIVL